MANGILEPEEAPSYEHFRKFSTFVPELADFAMTERQCGRLMAEHGLDMIAGQGLGDSHILFQQLSMSGCIVYESMVQLYRMLALRKKRVQERINLEKQNQLEEEKKIQERRQKYQSSGPSDSTHYDASLILDKMQQSTVGSKNTTPLPGATMPKSGHLRFSELLKPSATINSAQSASITKSVPVWGTHNPASTGPAWGSFAGPSHTSGMDAIMTKQDPPLILRESFPTPTCDISHIKTKIKGVREFLTNGEIKLCVGALKELYKEWEMALEEKRIVDELKRSKKKAAEPETAVPSTSAASGATDIPMEGSIFLLLMGACCALAVSDYTAAKRIVTFAESQYNSQILGLAHPYYSSIFLLQGINYYHQGNYEEGIQKFETTRDLADLVFRESNDPTAAKNSAVCLNNIGACLQMLGKRSQAVASYRAAVAGLRSSCGLHASVAQAALNNLNKAVRGSFALAPLPQRPKTAPSQALKPTQRPNSALLSSCPGSSSTGVAGLPVTVAAAGGKLQAFLKQEIMMSEPKRLTSLPVWATRSDGEEAMKKKASKGKDKDKDKDKNKDGKKSKKKKVAKGFTISYPMTYYNPPTFGVANVSIAVKKKGKKKSASK